MYTINFNNTVLYAYAIVFAPQYAHAYCYCNDKVTRMPVSIALPYSKISSIDLDGKPYNY